MICIILGTRPEIIKMSPVIRECQRLNIDYFILHTGQHYTYQMDKLFFSELKLPAPKYNIDVGSGRHGEQTAKMLAEIENILLEEKPEVVLVQGDTNTVLAGSLAASKLGIKIGHVEAGLRSFDRKMPEELNRIMSDHIADYLFAPTKKSKELLINEGIPHEMISVTGNTIVDSVMQNIQLIDEKKILDKWLLKRKNYILITAHRQENVDNKRNLTNILKGIDLITQDCGLNVIFPIHPRTAKKLTEFDLMQNVKKIRNLIIIEPVGFLELLVLEKCAKLIITDSGGLQEEACILNTPCITIRENTERPETVEVGANLLVGTNPQNMLEGSRKMMKANSDWKNPLGKGDSAEKIINFILNRHL
ncbi:UDP-N-acetylglucosamine 2-epimerase (non-hydrolyzing) [Methanolobus sp. WCC4]|uniref:non-hydrolyzing UDP-N-acetylglucosamine 2-epimerase n=1 Tax=Methanolobus sp. WCC4 TaxID=3125784 RepID=UPI0030F71EC6